MPTGIFQGLCGVADAKFRMSCLREKKNESRGGCVWDVSRDYPCGLFSFNRRLVRWNYDDTSAPDVVLTWAPFLNAPNHFLITSTDSTRHGKQQYWCC